MKFPQPQGGDAHEYFGPEVKNSHLRPFYALPGFDNAFPVAYTVTKWGCSSAGRALQSHCRGQGFESPQLHQFGVHKFGAVAQLGERLNGIQEVRGSNPLSSTTFPENKGLPSCGEGLFGYTTGCRLFDCAIQSG